MELEMQKHLYFFPMQFMLLARVCYAWFASSDTKTNSATEKEYPTQVLQWHLKFHAPSTVKYVVSRINFPTLVCNLSPLNYLFQEVFVSDATEFRCKWHWNLLEKMPVMLNRSLKIYWEEHMFLWIHHHRITINLNSISWQGGSNPHWFSSFK